MHNNFFFLRQLSRRLRETLTGFTVVSAFSQNRDEIVFEFNNGDQSHFIRADLNSSFSCLTFPNTFQRARKNSIDLFPSVIMRKVLGVTQFDNERAFSIELDNGLSIVFKMYGNRSNVLVAENDAVTEIFKQSIDTDLGLKPSTLHRTLDTSQEAFLAHREHPEKIYFTFGRPLLRYLAERGYYSLGAEAQWEMLQALLRELDHPTFHLTSWQHKLHLLLIKAGDVTASFHDPIEAANQFYWKFTSADAFTRLRDQLLSTTDKEVQQTKSWLEKSLQKLHELRADDHYKQWGDLLMANLHVVKPGATSINVDDFYNPGTNVEIKLDSQLTPQKNAERYYRKGKNQQIEIQKLQESITARTIALTTLEGRLVQIKAAQDVKELKKLVPDGTVEEQRRALPYREVEYKGFRIWIGKDARNNDDLTFHYGYKEDLWLHARDVPGSHVLIKYQAGKAFPKDVIEEAASLAAFYSKRKTDTLCPVIVTPKKFIRKRKGDPAGAVVVEREEVVIVEPKAHL